MAQQLITGAFRNDGGTPPAILVDGPPASGEGWTTGATIIELVTPSIMIGRAWKLIGWTISFVGVTQAGGGKPMWAKFGKIIGAIIQQGATRTILPANVPYTQPMLDLPSDSGSLVTIWDGNSDPPFPQQAGSQPAAAVTGSAQLPVPLTVTAGTQLGIGLWLTPSLIPTGGLPLLKLINGKYTVIFDDGR